VGEKKDGRNNREDQRMKHGTKKVGGYASPQPHHKINNLTV